MLPANTPIRRVERDDLEETFADALGTSTFDGSLQDFAGGTPVGVPARVLEPGMGFWVDKFDPPAP